MNKLLATIRKDFLLLRRDRAALVLLFLMPTALVLVISLVHDSTLRAMEGTDLELLLVDRDAGGDLAGALDRGLGASGFFRVIRQVDGHAPDAAEARKIVGDGGDIEVCLIVPSGASEAFNGRVRQRVLQAYSGATSPTAPTLAAIEVCFNADMLEAARHAVLSALQASLARIEAETMLVVIGQSPGAASVAPATSPAPQSLIFEEAFLPLGARRPHPSASEHNVAAWTVFGMFFIVVPLAASLIRERQTGVLGRLMTMPVSYMTVLTGKAMVYVGVCFLQFALMLLVGLYVLPEIGPERPSFVFDHPGLLVLVALCAAFAATGFGVLVGTIASSHEQASVFGAVAIIIASAVGGIMVPVFAMPPALRGPSVVSPLNWGLDAFLDVLTRGSGLSDIALDLARLLGFFALTLALAFWARQRRRV